MKLKKAMAVLSGVFALSSSFAFADLDKKDVFRQTYRSTVEKYGSSMSFDISIEDITSIMQEDEIAVAGVDVSEITAFSDNTLEIKYSSSKEDQEKLQGFVKDWAKKHIRPSMSEREKALVIYDFILANYKYQHGVEDEDSPYYSSSTLLKEGKGVCGAFAGMFRELGREAGLNVIDILGRVRVADNDLHAWNAVQIDGKWYFVDATFGMASKDKYEYFLCGSKSISFTHKYNKDKYPEISLRDLSEVRFGGK